MTCYSNHEHVVYVEAIRSIPGMVACMEERRHDDGRKLLTGYLATASKQGVGREQSWSILFTAAMHWIVNLTSQIATHVEISPADAARQMGMLASMWESEGCPSG